MSSETENPYFVTVSNNKTHLFQPLDLTVNGNCKKFMKSEFAKWYIKQVVNTLQVGTKNWKTSTLSSVYGETLRLLSNVIIK